MLQGMLGKKPYVVNGVLTLLSQHIARKEFVPDDVILRCIESVEQNRQ
jgi:hypothetical protein